MTEFKIVFVIAFFVESIWQALKPLWPKRLRELEKEDGVFVDAIGCALISLLLCFGTGVDLLAIVGIPLKIPYVGTVLTAFLLYRGSSFLHDVLMGVSNIFEKEKPISYIDTGVGVEEEPDPDAGL